MKRNRPIPITGTGTGSGHNAPPLTERQVELSAIEAELVKSAVAENTTAKQAADAQLAQRLSPIRSQYKLGDGTRADFRPSKDGKKVVMVVFEPKEPK